MADSKITALASLTGTNLATGDVFEVTDISDTSMDASGTSDSITAAELAAGLLRLAAGWVPDANTWTRTANDTFTLAVDATGWLTPSVRVRWKEGGAFKYGVVATSVFSSGTTTIKLVGTTDYSMAAIPDAASTSYAPSDAPGFPAYFNYTPTITGYSANPTNTAYTWRVRGRTIWITLRESTAGTSSATTHTYTLPANVTAATLTNQVWMMLCQVTNSGTASAGQARISSAATVIDTFASGSGGAWTASGSAMVQYATVFCEY